MRRQPPAKPKFLRPDTPPPAGSDSWRTPWVQLRTFSFSPTIYPAMIGAASADAHPGDLVSVYDKQGNHFGTGFFSPRAKVPLRVIHHSSEPVGEDHLADALDRAVDWRLQVQHLDPLTDAYRVVNSDGDGLSGLIVDRYADVLSVSVNGLGAHRRLAGWLDRLHGRLGTKREVVELDEQSARLEKLDPWPAPKTPVRTVRIREHEVRFEVDFTSGHKTGFFCDQRDNRRRFAGLVAGRRVLDLCCYTGGFAIAAAVRGQPGEVTGVDLDEAAIAQARRNGNLNQQPRLRWVHADAFAYARQMQKNGEHWGAIVCDPPKFIGSREEQLEGHRKYEDLNALAISLLEPGGVLVTCSCSGLLGLEEFERIVVRAAHRQDRRLQFFDRTGPGPDHPVMSNAPEGSYLKVLWANVR